jgi:hypothetical protein
MSNVASPRARILSITRWLLARFFVSDVPLPGRAVRLPGSWVSSFVASLVGRNVGVLSRVQRGCAKKWMSPIRGSIGCAAPKRGCPRSKPRSKSEKWVSSIEASTVVLDRPRKVGVLDRKGTATAVRCGRRALDQTRQYRFGAVFAVVSGRCRCGRRPHANQGGIDETGKP